MWRRYTWFWQLADSFTAKTLNTLWCRQIEPDVLAFDTLFMIKSWVDRCEEEEGHHSCLQSGPHILPNRVLDVGCSNDDDVKLVEVSSECGEYVALSYCWGPPSVSKQLPMTKKSNLEDFKVKLPLLPDSFKVVIAILRHLKIRYLWIDSLCVIQGLKSPVISHWQITHFIQTTWRTGSFKLLRWAPFTRMRLLPLRTVWEALFTMTSNFEAHCKNGWKYPGHLDQRRTWEAHS